jgi:signal transduction histidine kinase/DNA-binding response OmpR family regulator/sugar lactone lactonase YvrE
MTRRLLCLSLLLICTGAARAQAPLQRFEHLTINHGLPENSVRAILQDRQGFLWFGTQNGLARYDGTGMKVFLPDPDDSGSLALRFVLTMAEDDRGRIWMGSYGAGVSVYDPVTERFSNFTTEGDSLPGPGITTIKSSAESIWMTTNPGRLHRWSEDHFETVDIPFFDPRRTGGLTGLNVNARELWVGSANSGVAWFDRTNGSWRHLRHDPADPESLPSNFITFIERDSQGRLWVGSRSGLSLHRGDGRFLTFKPDPESGDSEDNYLVCWSEDPGGDFWIGSAVGLYHFQPDSGTFTLHAHDPDRPASPVLGPVLSVLVDRSGIVWAGSWHTGLNKYDPGSAKFDVYLGNPENPESLDHDSIGAVFEDSRGVLWVATGSRSSGGAQGSLNFRTVGQDAFRRLQLPVTARGDRVRTVHTISEDPDGMLWLGTDRGIWQLDPQALKVRRPATAAPIPEPALNTMISDMAIDPAGRIWLANWQGGLHRYDPLAGNWTSYLADPDDPHALATQDLTAVTLDGSGRIWAGTDSGGLYLYQPEQDDFLRLDRLGESLVSVLHIAPAGDGRVLVSTGSGIHLFDETGDLRSFTTRNGLPSDFIGLLITDRQDNIWASTGLGLVRIDAVSGEVRVFDERDGLPRNELYFAVCHTRDGQVYLGGQHGLVAFHPEHMKTNSFTPPVHITEVSVLDRTLPVGPDSPLKESLTLAKELRLGPRQNHLSLTFAALDYAHPERNRYRYRLEPQDQDWRPAVSGNMAHYTNLDPGAYRFSVMGSNSDGVWNETPAVLDIIITPPWYRTSWARALYVLTAAALILGVFRQILNRERMQLALEMERSESRHLQKLDQLKSQFFANISHEFRTPLTLLTAPLQRLQEDPASGNAELFQTMARNARRLARLIDQLLDLSRLEANQMPRHWRRGDWCQYLKVLSSSFATLAEQRQIVFTPRWPEQTPEAWYDPDILDKVLVNLLSNALKFTPAGGEVTLTVSLSPEPAPHPWPGPADQAQQPGLAYNLVLKVHNTGSHIPAQELDQVFDRFHQLVENTDFGDVGSGIGLALVKELTDWCHGAATVTSDPGRGTLFTIDMPLYRDPPPGAKPVQDEPEEVRPQLLDDELEDPLVDEALDDAREDDDQTCILLAEDSADLRNYVRGELQDEFRVILAGNGQSGLEMARSEIPDLILSDVMMPEMDGYELCRQVRADDLTSHIPVILLTARADPESRKQGLQVGADDYLAKPFDVEELRIRVRNLLEQRRMLAARHAQLEGARPGVSDHPLPSADDRFLTRTREIIVDNLDDPDFRVDRLCREIGMSRTQLHRKLKAVAGRSAGEFIRIERLNKAADMLSRREGNVTEVAYSVGYKSLSQFAKAFREQFGMAPSDFEG